MTNWLKRLFGGGSDESSTGDAPAAEPVTAPEPASMPAEPEPTVEPSTTDTSTSDPGDPPA